MRTLAAIQALIAAGLLLIGLITLFSMGITGLVFLLPAAVFAATAGAVSTMSKASVLLALAIDAPLAAYAASWLPRASGMDLAMAAAVVALVAAGFFSVLLDWRNVRASPWFAPD